MKLSLWQKVQTNSRFKLYLLSIFISLILLFWAIWQSKPIIAEPNDFFGVTSHLPVYYWFGLAILLFCSIFAFLDENIKGDLLFIFILLTLGLFLYTVEVFAMDNARSTVNYYPIAEVNNLLTTHYFNPLEPYSLNAYRSWPGIHFLSASIINISGLELGFVKYMPLFWMLCFIFVTYCIGKRQELPANRCFLLSFITLSSFWLLMADYSPQGLAFILYLLCIMFILTPRRSTVNNFMSILSFSALVILHPLTPLAVLFPLAIISIYRRDTNLIITLSVILLVWYIYQAGNAFKDSINIWWASPFGDLFRMTEVQRYVTPKPIPALVNRYMELSYMGIYGLGVLFAIALFIRKGFEARAKLINIFCWLLGIVLISIVFYGGTLEVRLYMFCIVLAATLIILSFTNQKVLIVLMVVFLALSLPTRNGNAVVWGQILTSELSGAKFVALEVKPDRNFFYDRTSQLMCYYNPDMVMLYDVGSFNSADIINISKLDNYDYIIISKQTRDRSIWLRGSDPYPAWLQTENGNKADLIYNNGYFQTYVNRSSG